MTTIKKFNESLEDSTKEFPREEGYYWVLFEGEWMPARYQKYEDNSGDTWDLCGSDWPLKTDEFEKIGDKIEYKK
jgi:hypothetical protein